MLDNNYREIVCIKRMVTGIVSRITFSGIFNNVRIIEEFLVDNRTIKISYKTLSKKNAANYIIEKGYYIFGIEKDILENFIDENVTKKSLIKHYNNYCIPIIQYMFDVIKLHNISKNDIIDVVVAGQLNPNKINNHNIKYTSITKIDTKQILAKGLEYQNKQMSGKRKTYWKAIND